MNIIRKVQEALYQRHLAHKGEMVAHLTYLGATFFGSHGVASVAAGILALIIIVGLAVQHAIE